MSTSAVYNQSMEGKETYHFSEGTGTELIKGMNVSDSICLSKVPLECIYNYTFFGFSSSFTELYPIAGILGLSPHMSN
jgi:hypothetical protein